jgi:predicted phosphohydrolase
MDIFGPAWERHAERLREAWTEAVSHEDVVLIPGDISWAMREPEVAADMAYLRSLPGRKILLKGNHDYWWSTRSRVLALLGAEHGAVLQNGAVDIGPFALVGTRGWDIPAPRSEADDLRLYNREVKRMRLSLDAGAVLGKPMIALLHHPPLADPDSPTPLASLLEVFGVRICVYGHLHGAASRQRVEGTVRGVTYHLVAADHLGFRPLLIWSDMHAKPRLAE